MPNLRALSISLFLLLLAGKVLSANHDAFIQAKPTDKAYSFQLQANIDFMNKTFDVFGFGDSIDESSQYKGGSIEAGFSIGPYVWIEGGYQLRQLEVGNILADVESWQIASQVLVIDITHFQLTLRGSFWGNSTDRVNRNYNLLSGSTRTSLVNLQKPHDQQAQLDLIAGFELTPKSKMNLFISAGKTEVDFKKIHSEGSYGGCEYLLSFTATGYFGELTKPCYEDLVITEIYTPYTAKDIRPHKELHYNGQFYKIGLNSQWENRVWRLRTAYVFSHTERNGLDDILFKRGQRGTNDNHLLSAEVAYKVQQHFALTLAGHYLHNQFTGEIPFLYNSISAKYFNHRYGLISVGFLLNL